MSRYRPRTPPGPARPGPGPAPGPQALYGACSPLHAGVLPAPAPAARPRPANPHERIKPMSSKQADLGIQCKQCGSSVWKIRHVNETELDMAKKTADYSSVPEEEIRCAQCNRKATVQEHSEIVTSEMYKAAMDPTVALEGVSDEDLEDAEDGLTITREELEELDN